MARVDRYTILEDETFVVDAAAGLLANDVDPQGDEMTVELVRDVFDGSLAPWIAVLAVILLPVAMLLRRSIRRGHAAQAQAVPAHKAAAAPRQPPPSDM